MWEGLFKEKATFFSFSQRFDNKIIALSKEKIFFIFEIISLHYSVPYKKFLNRSI